MIKFSDVQCYCYIDYCNIATLHYCDNDVLYNYSKNYQRGENYQQSSIRQNKL